MRKQGRSGQILAVSALAIALIMISTATYIYDLSVNIGDDETVSLNNYAASVTLGSKHAVISALANITHGGNNGILVEDLNMWSSFLGRQYAFGTISLNHTLRNTAPYTSGLYLDWGTLGIGVSEAYADFTLNAIGRQLRMQYPFHVNVSTDLRIEGNITQISPLTEQVALVLRLSNEGQPALARNLTVLYKDLDAWLIPSTFDNYGLLDYGNGTYRAVFTLAASASSLDVSARVLDSRGIFVQTNDTVTLQ